MQTLITFQILLLHVNLFELSEFHLHVVVSQLKMLSKIIDFLLVSLG